MALPKAKDSEQQKKRTAAASKSSGPAPEQKIQLPSTPLNPTFENTAPKPVPGNGGAGEADTPNGKVNIAPISPDLKAKFEKSFSVDLSAITVHTGPGADAQCAARGAQAYIRGNDVFMSEQAGKAGSKKYSQVLGHEVAHFVQQNGGGKAQAEGVGSKKDAGKEGAGGDAEKDADQAGEKAADGGEAKVAASAPKGAEQKKEAKPEHKNPNTVKIPIGDGKSIEFVPPNKDGDWSLGVGNIKELAAGIQEKADKWWRKAIPTGFFGLNLELGAGVFAEFKLGAVDLKGIKVNYKKADDAYEIEGEIGSGMSLEVGGFLSAGVSADAWIASCGVGLKAKLSLTKSHPISASFKAGYSKRTGEFTMGGKLSLAALELEAKAAVALYVYYDAWGISTYSKDWTLYERTLGKISFAGVDFNLEYGSKSGWAGSKIEPKPLEMQGFSGNIKKCYPQKS